MTTNVFTAIGIKSSRMQIRNFTTTLSVDKVKVKSFSKNKIDWNFPIMLSLVVKYKRNFKR